MVALWCTYRGADFHGYQQQAFVRTVQGELLRAFAAAGLTRNPSVAGRTDKGVSARMQVLSARLEADVPCESLVERLNAQLPDDIRIRLVREAAKGFHAAWSASSKEYRYQLAPDDIGDRALFDQAASLIAGTRNFTVFHFKTSQDKPRTVTSVEASPDGTIRLVGEGFARHMVRMLVGGITAVSQGRVPLEVFRAGLEQQRNFYCPTAPAEPLTLWSVDYPPEVDPFSKEDRVLTAA